MQTVEQRLAALESSVGGAAGQAAIPFTDWTDEDSIAVTGQTTILTTSKIIAGIYADNDDIYLNDWQPPIITNIIAGTGFTIVLRNKHGVFKGPVKINWRWS